MKKILIGISIAAICIVSAGAIQSQQMKTMQEITKVDSKEGGFVKDYKVYSYNLPADLNFAGEKVPVKSPDIMERADREFLVNTYWQSNGILLIKRAEKYFPTIEKILKEEGVPDDFKYLSVIESGLQNVVSPAGARGFWQIMPQTGKELDLEVNDNVDERYHLEKSTRAACKYLKDSKEKLGSWTLAAAAYNAGNAGISRQLDRQQVSEYYDLLLGEETGRYMFRIIAMKEIMSDPKSFGFNVEQEHKYTHIPTEAEVVDYEIDDLAAFAKARNINYKILKIHNPWLRESNLNNKSKKRYEFEIPEKGFYN
jgi:hypothetical protein